MTVSAAGQRFPSAGNAAADLPFVRTVWKKIFGACPATVLHGNARIAGDIMGLGINEMASGSRFLVTLPAPGDGKYEDRL